MLSDFLLLDQFLHLLIWLLFNTLLGVASICAILQRYLGGGTTGSGSGVVDRPIDRSVVHLMAPCES
jgi:hypothetical protein